MIIFLRKALNKMIVTLDSSTSEDSDALQKETLENITLKTDFIKMTSYVLSLQVQSPEAEQFISESLWILANLLLCKPAVEMVIEPSLTFLDHFRLLFKTEVKSIKEQIYWVMGNLTGESDDIGFIVEKRCRLL